MRYVIAVDPGLTGAVAVFYKWGGLVEVFDMPTEEVGEGFVSRQVCAVGLRQRLEGYLSPTEKAGDLAYPGANAVMERVTAMPGQGVSSTLSLGDTRGCIRGVLRAIGIPVAEVLPQKWKGALGLLQPRPKGKGKMSQKEKNERQAKAKADSLALARRLYPQAALWLERAKDHNRAEAILLGHYITQQQQQVNRQHG